MRHASIRAVVAYWNTLRGARAAPQRTEINPRGLGAVLGDVFLLESTRETFRFRLAGSRIGEALGHDLTGAPFAELWQTSAREDAEQALLIAVTETIPVLIGTRLADTTASPVPSQSTGMDWLNLRRSPELGGFERRIAPEAIGELVLLPLAHPARDGARILGAFCPARMPVVAPAHPRRLDVTTVRILGDDARPRSGIRLISGALAETAIARRGHLTVFKGDGGKNPR